MSSNYNRIPRPPVVMLAKGSHTVAVRRESFADIAATVADYLGVPLDTPGKSFASQILR